jgi:hypothetical protein
MLERHYRVFKVMAVAWWAGIITAACQPRVALEAPKDPIVINLNVKVEHEVRVKIDKELEDVFEKNPELFGQ